MLTTAEVTKRGWFDCSKCQQRRIALTPFHIDVNGVTQCASHLAGPASKPEPKPLTTAIHELEEKICKLIMEFEGQQELIVKHIKPTRHGLGNETTGITLSGFEVLQ